MSFAKGTIGMDCPTRSPTMMELVLQPRSMSPMRWRSPFPNAVNLSGQNAMAPVAAQAVSAILAVSQVGAEQCKPASKE